MAHINPTTIPTPMDITPQQIQQSTDQTLHVWRSLQSAFINDQSAAKEVLCGLVEQTLASMPWLIALINLLPGITVMTARGKWKATFSQQMFNEDQMEARMKLAQQNAMQQNAMQQNAIQSQQGQGRLFH